MEATALEAYLHKNIPLTYAMGLKVTTLEPSSITLYAPLQPNINHQQTAFGGSLASLATLSAWCTVFITLKNRDITADIVVSNSQIEYLAPVKKDFYAHSTTTSEALQALTKDLITYGKTRITLSSKILAGTHTALHFSGEFVVSLSPPKKHRSR